MIGASAEDGKIGNSVMKNLINGGYKGEIYPIHPKADEILGLQGLQERQGRARRDRHRGVRDSRQVRAPARWSSAARRKFRRGADSVGLCRSRRRRELQAEIVEIGKKYNVRLMGPNIYGFYYTPANLCATFCTAYDVKGSAALSSQSGGIGMAIIGFSRSAKMGVSAIVGLGNKSDIDEDDLLDLLRAGLRTPRSSRSTART